MSEREKIPDASTPRLAPGAPESIRDLVAAVERIHEEHRVSFIAAGDEKIYAYGGNGYVAIVSDRMFGGLVEVETPSGNLRVEPDDEGRLAATPDAGVTRDVGELLAETVRNMLLYYERRYWR